MIIEKYLIPCSHKTMVYDEQRGELICSECGEIQTEHSYWANNNYFGFLHKIEYSEQKPTKSHYYNNVKGSKTSSPITRKIKKFQLMGVSIFDCSLKKVQRLMELIIPELRRFQLEKIILNIEYYYKKIPTDMISVTRAKKRHTYRPFELLFVLSYYLEFNKYISLNDFLDLIATQHICFKMPLFNEITMLLKSKAPSVIKQIIQQLQLNHDHIINARIINNIHKIVDTIDVSLIRTNQPIVPMFMKEISIDTSKSILENWRQFLIKRSSKIIDQLNLSSNSMQLNTICSGLIYIASKGSITQKNVSKICQVCELTTNNTISKMEIFLQKKCPSLLS